jgi:hypothetical protein
MRGVPSAGAIADNAGRRGTGLVRIPRAFLHLALGDLAGVGVSEPAQAALRGLIADLPLVPDASVSAQLIGPAEVSLPCLAALARHVGQGLRDHNLSFSHDRPRLRAERCKLIFLDNDALAELIRRGDQRPRREAVVFVAGAQPSVLDLLHERQRAGLASFVTTTLPLADLVQWRTVRLR